MKSDTSHEFNWRERLKNGNAIHNIVTMRPELPLFLIEWDQRPEAPTRRKPLHWIELGEPSKRLKPQHFETFFGKDHVRDKHYLDALSEASQTKKTVIKSVFGTRNLFHPLSIENGKPLAFIYAGHFFTEPPNWEMLSDAWLDMTGQDATSANPDFVSFVQMALTLPVFDEELLAAVKKFVALYADYLVSGYDNIEIRNEINTLNSTTFAEHWPICDWVDDVIAPNKFIPPPWHFLGELPDWLKTGMGLSSLPTTAIAMMPLDSTNEVLDPVKTLLRNAEIQRECILFGRSMDRTAATRLQDYGISIITSCGKSQNDAQTRIELRETAEKFRKFIDKKFGVNMVAGIGRSLTPGSPLKESHREAVLALHMCVQLNSSVLFFDEHGSDKKFKYARIQQAADELLKALNQESNTALKLACDRYVQMVLTYSNQRIEVARGQFLAALFQMFNTVQRRNPMRQEARNNFIADLADKVEQTRSVEQLIESFNDALQRLSFVSTKAWRGPSVMLLEATLQYIKENYFEPLPLPDVARKAGFSVPVFTRVFKQATGTSYLNYVRQVRINHAKKLLSTTMLTLEQVAQACGFNSQHHLIRSFKKVTDMTPGAYRKNNSTLIIEE